MGNCFEHYNSDKLPATFQNPSDVLKWAASINSGEVHIAKRICLPFLISLNNKYNNKYKKLTLEIQASCGIYEPIKTKQFLL